jgi:hypothetical protein
VEFLEIFFPLSGVRTYIFIPPLVSFVISFFTSMAGVSGAFLLLPFQVSVLKYTTPSVSATNFVYNIVAIPSGVYRYMKERRMAWPLTWVIIAGTLPGVFIGYYVRVVFLPEPHSFKFFVGIVLLYIGLRLFQEFTGFKRKIHQGSLDKKFREISGQLRERHGVRFAAGIPSEAIVKTVSVSPYRISYDFWGERFSFSVPLMFLLAFLVGVVGGTYGIGGGAIIAPFCVAVFRLPVYTVAGAALMGTLLTSVAGVLFYSIIPAEQGLQTSPDWLLGSLFGAGGFAGMYLGARFQKFVPQRLLKLGLAVLILFVAFKYIVQFFVK